MLGELCTGLVLVSSPVAKCAYKQHRYRNKCISTRSISSWALSVGGVSPPLRQDMQGVCLVNALVDYIKDNEYQMDKTQMYRFLCLSSYRIASWVLQVRITNWE